MGEVKKTTKKITKKTSPSKKKKLTPSQLSNEELLEQILNKKKKVKTLEIKEEKVDVSKLGNEELLDFIMAKKKKKVSSKKTQPKKVQTKEIKTDKIEEQTTVISPENLVEKVQEKLHEEEITKVDLKKSVRRKTTFKRLVFSTLCLLIPCFISFGIDYSKKTNESYSILEEISAENAKKIEEEKQQQFNACLSREYSESEETEEILNKKNELTEYLKNYNLSVGYKDLTYGYSFYDNKDAIYYAASTIKSLDALYIYTKAAAGEIDLDSTLTYTSSVRMGSSIATEKLRYGTKISLRDLVKYTITVSDNSAHNMLLNYIGKNNLREFGESLGATTTLTEWDIFGNINVNDAMIYMDAIYKFTKENGELGQELASYFIESEDNNLKFEDLGINALVKYGNYDIFYHNIGVVDSTHPYLLVILTKIGQNNGREVMPVIRDKVMEIHNLYYSNRQSQCILDVYGN